MQHFATSPSHPSSIRSAVHASSIIPEYENVPRGSKPSYPGYGGTVIHHDVSVMAEHLGCRSRDGQTIGRMTLLLHTNPTWTTQSHFELQRYTRVSTRILYRIAVDIEAKQFPKVQRSFLKRHKIRTIQLLKRQVSKGHKGHTHHESPQVVTSTVPLWSCEGESWTEIAPSWP